MKKIINPANSAKIMWAYSHWLEIDLTKAKKMLFVTG